jgi:hypothetical protein
VCSDHASRPKNVVRALVHGRSDAGESDASMLPMQAASAASSTKVVRMVAISDLTCTQGAHPSHAVELEACADRSISRW